MRGLVRCRADHLVTGRFEDGNHLFPAATGEMAGEESTTADQKSERLFVAHLVQILGPRFYGPEGNGIKHAEDEQQRAPPHSDVISRLNYDVRLRAAMS